VADDDLPPQNTVWDLMDIGQSFAVIEQIRASGELGCTSYDKFVQRVREFYEVVEGSQLSQSARLVDELLEDLDKRQQMINEGSENVLDAGLAHDLKHSLNALWDRVRDEASNHQAYVVTSLDHPQFNLFIESPREGFGLELAYDPSLPPELDENLNEAARCLSVGFAVAATFFILRAMDVLLKHYHGKMTGKDSGKVWGRLRCDLKVVAPDDLLEALEKLTVKRNQIMHVKRNGLKLDPKTASEVLIESGDVAMRIMQHLEEEGKIKPMTVSPAELEFSEE
jgi:hypothetical protein